MHFDASHSSPAHSYVPQGWRRADLGDVVAQIQQGFSSGVNNDEGRGVAHLRPMNIDRAGRIARDVVKYVERSEVPLLQAGDVVFNNTNSLDHVGKSSMIEEGDPWSFSNHITRIVPTETLLAEFLLYQLLMYQRTGYFKRIARQHVNQASVSIKSLKSLPVLIAPMGEQHEIVTRLHRDFQMLTDIERTAEQVTRRSVQLENSTLQKIAEGTLGLNREVDGARRPYSTVGQVGEVQLGKMRQPSSHYGPDMKPYLRVANVLEDRLDLSDVHQMNFTTVEQEKYRLRSGDILLNEGQSPELVGRPAMYRGELSECYFQKTLLRFRTRSGNSSAFYLLVFRHYLRSGKFREIARWTTNIAHLSAERFVRLEVPAPPLDEQERLAFEGNNRLSDVETLLALVGNIASRVDRARTQLLQERFHQAGSSAPGLEPPPLNRLISDGSRDGVEERPMPQRTRISGQRRPVADVLGMPHSSGLTPEELFAGSGFSDETVDDFYEELRESIRAGLIVHELVDGASRLRRR